jgi:ribosomal protein L16/L10AE
MLAPKKIKFRKSQKMRLKGPATRGAEWPSAIWGSVPGSRQADLAAIEAARIAITRT